jgi:hypothetical protein
MTTRSLALITASLVSLPAFAADAQRSAHPAADTWHDTAPHTTKFVTVAPNVKLHYLDFGGGGEPIVLLAGLETPRTRSMTSPLGSPTSFA